MRMRDLMLAVGLCAWTATLAGVACGAPPALSFRLSRGGLKEPSHVCGPLAERPRSRASSPAERLTRPR